MSTGEVTNQINEWKRIIWTRVLVVKNHSHDFKKLNLRYHRFIQLNMFTLKVTKSYLVISLTLKGQLMTNDTFQNGLNGLRIRALHRTKYKRNILPWLKAFSYIVTFSYITILIFIYMLFSRSKVFMFKNDQML